MFSRERPRFLVCPSKSKGNSGIILLKSKQNISHTAGRAFECRAFPTYLPCTKCNIPLKFWENKMIDPRWFQIWSLIMTVIQITVLIFTQRMKSQRCTLLICIWGKQDLNFTVTFTGRPTSPSTTLHPPQWFSLSDCDFSLVACICCIHFLTFSSISPLDLSRPTW